MTISTLLAATAAEKIDLAEAKTRFAKIVQEELARDILPGVSVAWVVDGKTVYEDGFGFADWDTQRPATPQTVYRAGSISKLFNAVAAMQLVERGMLDLDAPIQKALPEFQIVVPFENAIPLTVRQMLCHRSGMIRECPTGGYLDPNEPSVKETVASVAPCALVNLPNMKTRYSNVGPTIVGRAVEVQTGEAYPDYQQKNILKPLGMNNSAWLMNDQLKPHLAKGKMRVAVGDGSYRYGAAPTFELGTIPAGNLYSTAGDLARFASFIMATPEERSGMPKVLKAESIDQMCTVQLTEDASNFGLGFRIDPYRGRKSVHHGGAVYGFSTLLMILPKERIAAVTLTNSDISSGAVKRLNEATLNLLLAVTEGEEIPAPTKTISLSREELARFTGDYESLGYWARLYVEDGKLLGEFSGQNIEFEAVEPLKLVATGRIMNRAPFEFEADESGKIVGFTASNQKFTRIDPKPSATAPASWKKFVGSYGPRFIPLVVSIRNGHLYATAENEYDYRLMPLNRVTFRLPPGMYDDEHVVFQLDPDGNPLGVVMANMYLPRQ